MPLFQKGIAKLSKHCVALTAPEIDDPDAFLASLTSSQHKELGAKEVARQREIARTHRPQRDTARAFGPKPPRGAPLIAVGVPSNGHPYRNLRSPPLPTSSESAWRGVGLNRLGLRGC